MIKKLRLYIVIAIYCLMVLLMYGCNSTNKNISNNQTMFEANETADITTAIPTIASADDTLPPDRSADESMNENSNEALDDLSKFKNIKDCFLDYQFTPVKGGVNGRKL